jgi:hypothetical protein
MATQAEKTNSFIRTYMPIAVVFVTGLAAFYRLEAKVDQHIAVDTQDAIHTKETMEEIKGDVKEIKGFLIDGLTK